MRKRKTYSYADVMGFFAGDVVQCIDDTGPSVRGRLQKGMLYTVEKPHAGNCVYLEGIARNCSWANRRFALVVPAQKLEPSRTLEEYMSKAYGKSPAMDFLPSLREHNSILWRAQDARMNEPFKPKQYNSTFRPLPLGWIEATVIGVVAIAFMLGLAAFALGVCSKLGCGG